MVTRDRFPLSAVGLGLAFVIPWSQCLAMFLGAFVFWLAEKTWRNTQSQGNRIIVQNQEPICAGLISGAGSASLSLRRILRSWLRQRSSWCRPPCNNGSVT